MLSNRIDLNPKYVTPKGSKEKICDRGENKHAEDDKFKLHAAIKRNDMETVKELISRGSDIDEMDNKGDAPFVTAIRNDNPDALKMLIDARCDLTNMDGLNSSALGLAAIYGNIDCITAILDAGEDLDEASYFSHSSLMLSAFQGQYDVVKLLLERGADPNYVNRHGMTALHKSMMIVDNPNEENRHKLVAVLLQYGADPLKVLVGDYHNSFIVLGRICPLSFAVATGYSSLVQMILIAGHDIKLSDVDNWRQGCQDTFQYPLYSSPEILGPILEWVTNPRTLLQISRNAIRKLLPQPIPLTVQHLETYIGKNLADYINYSDLVNLECEPAANRHEVLKAFPKDLHQLEDGTMRLKQMVEK